MDKIDFIKISVSAMLGYIFGGWDGLMKVLVFAMALDYTLGLLVAGVWKNSPKTENGAIETRAGLKGLIRKGSVLVLVLIVWHLEQTLGSTLFCRNTVILFFLANELLSVLENIGLMGVKYPKSLKNALEVLLRKSDERKENTDEDMH